VKSQTAARAQGIEIGRPGGTVAIIATIWVALLALLAAPASGSGGHRRVGASIIGQVEVAGEPRAGWRVELRAATSQGSRLLDAAVSRGDGRFRLRPRRASRDAVLYVLANRGATQRMLAVLGPPAEASRKVVVNELSTVASVWTSAQFIDGASIRRNRVGLVAAARNVPNLVDLETGGLGKVVQNAVNGTRTNTVATINTLASILADCLQEGCADFFALATPPGEPLATTTLEALVYVARNPWHNVVPIFELRPAASDGADDNPAFIPTLLWPPTAWTLSLVYAEGGFNAPGGMSIDAWGGLWTNNNFMPGSQSILTNTLGPPSPSIAYTGTGATQLRSNGTAQSPATGYLGGGTFGAAFGIAIDQRGHVFIGNFAGDSLSELRPDGSPVSPDSSSPYASDGGYHHPSFDDIQSVIVDRSGHVWVTNLGGNSVSQLVDGDPNDIRVWGLGCDDGFERPWGLASDGQGRVWVTNFAANSVSVIDPTTAGDLCPLASYPLSNDPLSAPQGVAVDQQGNVWVARTAGAGVTLLKASEGFTPPHTFDADRTAVGPWGVAIDGNDNVWVANFGSKRLSHFCGLNTAACPPGLSTGEPISPDITGYAFDGLVRNTGVAIDQAGNVWVANNFDDVGVCLEGSAVTPEGELTTVQEERQQTHCGGNGAVVVFGVAKPVAAPLIGPPRPPPLAPSPDGRQP